MRRFICQCNIEHFESLLRAESYPATVTRIRELLAAERRSYALLTSAELGARPPATIHQPPAQPSADDTAFRDAFHAASAAMILLDPGPGLKILDVNRRVEEISGLPKAEVVGRPFFDVFPDNPDHTLADGVSNLAASLRIAAETGRPHAMAPQRYDLRGDDGVFRARYWTPVNTPVLDAEGRLLYLVHESREVAPPPPEA